MNYEKIIVELLGRIQVLEEKVAMMENREQAPKQEAGKATTDDIRQYISNLKKNARETGEKTIVLRSGDLHKDMGLKNAMPMVCNAMRQSMGADDVVLHTTPSGNSSTIEILYHV